MIGPHCPLCFMQLPLTDDGDATLREHQESGACVPSRPPPEVIRADAMCRVEGARRLTAYVLAGRLDPLDGIAAAIDLLEVAKAELHVSS